MRSSLPLGWKSEDFPLNMWDRSFFSRSRLTRKIKKKATKRLDGRRSSVKCLWGQNGEQRHCYLWHLDWDQGGLAGASLLIVTERRPKEGDKLVSCWKGVRFHCLRSLSLHLGVFAGCITTTRLQVHRPPSRRGAGPVSIKHLRVGVLVQDQYCLFVHNG